jgi:hypothetical protein
MWGGGDLVRAVAVLDDRRGHVKRRDLGAGRLGVGLGRFRRRDRARRSQETERDHEGGAEAPPPGGPRWGDARAFAGGRPWGRDY